MHNLRSIVATSYVYLEGAATEADQSLARNPTTTVHDYVLNFLPKHCLGIDLGLCQAYVDAYERARFSNEEFTLAEFTEFKEQFRQLLEFLHNLKKPQRSSSSKQKQQQHHHNSNYHQQSSHIGSVSGVGVGSGGGGNKLKSTSEQHKEILTRSLKKEA